LKIAVSAEGPDLEALVGQRFGISPYLVIVDPQTMDVEAASNPGAAGQRAAGLQAVGLPSAKRSMRL